MNIKLGILLPIGLEPLNKNIDLNNIKKYVDSIWVRDIPIASKETKNIGTWYDPFIYLNYLSTNLKNYKGMYGIAALNSSIRDLIITIKEILTFQILINKNLYVAFGSSEENTLLNYYKILDKTNKNKKLYEFYNTVYKVIILKNDTIFKDLSYFIPDINIKNNFIISSGEEEVLKNIINLEIWMTKFLTPDKFKNKLEIVKKYNNCNEIIMLFNIIICNNSKIKFGIYNNIKCIYISFDKLYELFSIYKKLGVTTFLISFLKEENYEINIKIIRKIINNLNKRRKI